MLNQLHLFAALHTAMILAFVLVLTIVEVLIFFYEVAKQWPVGRWRLRWEIFCCLVWLIVISTLTIALILLGHWVVNQLLAKTGLSLSSTRRPLLNHVVSAS